MKPAALLLTAAVIVLNVLGNFALSWGMKKAPATAGPVVALLEPAVMLGIALLIAWTILRIRLLGLADLSYILPLTATGYLLNALAGAVFLHEHVSPLRWAGALLIAAGAALTSGTPPETHHAGGREREP